MNLIEKKKQQHQAYLIRVNNHRTGLNSDSSTISINKNKYSFSRQSTKKANVNFNFD